MLANLICLIGGIAVGAIFRPQAVKAWDWIATKFERDDS